jgi:hypothetical protein
MFCRDSNTASRQPIDNRCFAYHYCSYISWLKSCVRIWNEVYAVDLIAFILCRVSMASSSSGSSQKRGADQQLVPHQQPKLSKDVPSAVRRALVQCGSKSGLTTALLTLQDAGLLETHDNEFELRNMLRDASTEHSNAMTPYGRVVQSCDLGVPGLKVWEYCHPMAFMHYISTLTDSFGLLMSACLPRNMTGHIIVYIDEICPGNPFRPEKSRTLQCVYWCFSDWPQWLISRSAAWPCFGVLRSALVGWIPGGISGLMRKILTLMFLSEHNFDTGVLLVVDSKRLLVRGVYDGLMADEKALKECNGLKGAQGFSDTHILDRCPSAL